MNLRLYKPFPTTPLIPTFGQQDGPTPGGVLRTIFVAKNSRLFWSMIDGIFPSIRITLRAEKALRVISVSWKNLSSLRDFSKTIDWTQGRQYPKGIAQTLEGKVFPCALNSQLLSRKHFCGEKFEIVLEHDWCNFPLNPNDSKSREGSTSHFGVM